MNKLEVNSDLFLVDGYFTCVSCCTFNFNHFFLSGHRLRFNIRCKQGLNIRVPTLFVQIVDQRTFKTNTMSPLCCCVLCNITGKCLVLFETTTFFPNLLCKSIKELGMTWC